MLGLMVGRGNSPITFDTRSFEQQLENIAEKLANIESEKEEVNLEFFKVLDQPVAEEKALPKITKSKIESEISPQPPVVIPIKTSTKKRTFQKRIMVPKKKDVPKKITTVPVPVVPVKITKGRYTIQIAAYKDFKDAVTQMAILEKKGIKSYRQKGEKDGVTWYRVRTGVFNSFEEAKKFKEKLNRIKIKAMVIKKDNKKG